MSERTVVLFGDSILDNAPYTRPAPDTTAHLERLLAPDWTVARLARDGAVMGDLPRQLAQLRGRGDAAVLSIGGNDAVRHIGLLERRATTAAEVLDELLEITDDFGRRYDRAAQAVAERSERTVLCTIYDVRLEPAPYARIVRAPLALLNDRIVRTAARLGLDVLELRSVCTESDDFVLQIEPSAQGAAKIARALAALLRDNAAPGPARVFAPRLADARPGPDHVR